MERPRPAAEPAETEVEAIPFADRYASDPDFQTAVDESRNILFQSTEARLDWDSAVTHYPDGTLAESMRDASGTEITGRTALWRYLQSGDDAALRQFVEGNGTMHTDDHHEADGTPAPPTAALGDALRTFFRAIRMKEPKWLHESSS